MRKRLERGFTLIEVLIVIAIIAILGSMITGGAMYAKNRAAFVKAKSNMAALSTALEAYNQITGTYPSSGWPGKAQDRPEELFTALYTGNVKIGGSRENHVGDWPGESLGKWTGQPLEFYENPTEEELDYSTNRLTKCVFLDPWGHEYHYVEFESRAAPDRILSNGQLRAKGGQSYAIWSNGPDGKNDWGKNDDVNSWTEGGKSTQASQSGGGRR